MITIMKHGLCIGLFALLLLFSNTSARGGGRGGRRGGSRGRYYGGGGGGLAWAYNSYFSESPYGNTFGRKCLPDNSYISSNDYKYKGSSRYLIDSLFYGAGTQNADIEESRKYHFNSIGSDGFYRSWNEEKDKEWRKTTRAPFFENKLPGTRKIFPASAVVGAATAFGLVSLLPLNVPPGKPLMYCGNTDIIQTPLRINEDIYVCNKNKFEISCRMVFQNRFDHDCDNEEVQCDLENGIIDNIYCSRGTLVSKTNMFCDSTTTINRRDLNETVTFINCYEGQLPKSKTSFIPTTTTTTESPYFTTTPKPLSFNAKVHVFLLNLMGKSDVLETTTPETFPYTDSDAWHPEALTIPTETTTTTTWPTTTKAVTTTTTENPYVWMMNVNYYNSGEEELVPAPRDRVDPIEHYGDYIPQHYVKVNKKLVERITQKS